MSKKLATLFTALGLVALMGSHVANAAPTITASSATGSFGQSVGVTFTIASDSSLDTSSLASYDFSLTWDTSVLQFEALAPSFSGATEYSIPAAGSFATQGQFWYSTNPPNDYLSLGNPISITGTFKIIGTNPNPSTVFFSTFLTDSRYTGYEADPGFYSGQSSADVTIQAVPEPAEVSMLLAGLGLMAAVVRRRKIRLAA